MKGIVPVIALATVFAVLPAWAAVNDPLRVIYRVTGVTDDGGSFETGIATSFHCTNFGSTTEALKFLVKRNDGTVKGTGFANVAAGGTVTLSTHATKLFTEAAIPEGAVQQGSAIISATAPDKIYCSAMIVDAAVTAPQGIALHMVRFNPITNTQE